MTSKTEGGKVNILDPKALLQLAQDSSGAGRAHLARAISDFFKEHHLSENEQSLACDILMNLIRQAEIDLREALAENLSTQDGVPPGLIIFLANDEISVARSVLMHSPVLKDFDLIDVIDAKGTEHWQAVAQRALISPLIADKLIDTKDPSVILKLVDNQRARLQKQTLKKLIKAAIVSQEVQAPLLRRPEIDADMATDLYLIVAQALRKEIADKFPINAAQVEKSFELIVQELSNEARGYSRVSDEMKALAVRFAERGDISTDLLIKVLRRGQMGFFVALFSCKSGFQAESVVRMIQKEGSKPFIVVCRAMGMMKAEFASLFLLSRGIRSGDKIVDQRELAMALKDFDALKETDAARIVKVWLQNPEKI